MCQNLAEQLSSLPLLPTVLFVILLSLNHIGPSCSRIEFTSQIRDIIHNFHWIVIFEISILIFSSSTVCLLRANANPKYSKMYALNSIKFIKVRPNYSLMNMRQLHILFNSAKTWHVIVCWFLCFPPNLPVLNLKLICSDVQNNFRFSSGKFGGKHRNQQSHVKFWMNWIKYGAVSYSLSCIKFYTTVEWQSSRRTFNYFSVTSTFCYSIVLLELSPFLCSRVSIEMCFNVFWRNFTLGICK